MNAAEQPIHTESVRWRLPEQHPSPGLPLDEISRVLHNAAGNQVQGLGIGIDDLHREDKTWMLSRFKAYVRWLPNPEEELEAVTWPWKADSLRYYRDYLLRSSNGSPAVSATSQWLMVDLTRRRPVRVRDLTHILPPIPDKRALDEELGKLEFSLPREVRQRVHIEEQHLDLNRHVNNAQYLNWITPVLEQESWLNGRSGFSFEIHFNAEARLGDVIDVEMSPVQPGKALEALIRREEDGSTLTQFRISPA
jgi:acyl-ACP thioesterase